MLKETPLNFELIKEKDHGPLNFPGKVLADAGSNRLFIADSTNHRIVITDLDGKKIAVAGTGKEGFKDGSFDKARFSDPQGMALDGDTLYVADRKNHSIRALDLKKQDGQDGGRHRRTGPRSPAGRPGAQDRPQQPLGPAAAQGQDLHRHGRAPSDLDLRPRRTTSVEPFAGNGAEDLVDGPLADSSFAQPSGLATDGKNLFVADSEISAIRSVPLDGEGMVKTIVGEGLFEFGDKDGVGNEVRLQHALGVAYRDGKLYVADTYNSKIKIIDPVKRSCETFVGDGSTKTFFEPAGLSFAGDKLYVADTNNHRIQVIDMKNRQVETLILSGVEPPLRERPAIEKPVEKK